MKNAEHVSATLEVAINTMHENALSQQIKEHTYVKPPYARFKLQIYYRDGNRRMYYSWDYIDIQTDKKVAYRILDERAGFAYLHNYVKEQVRIDNIKTAMIFTTLSLTDTDTHSYNYQIAHFVRSTPTRPRPVKWTPIKFLYHQQKEKQFEPLTARLESVVNCDHARSYFAINPNKLYLKRQ